MSTRLCLLGLLTGLAPPTRAAEDPKLRELRSAYASKLAPWLGEASQLLRFDVISAFAESKDPQARTILEKHREREKQPYLLKMLKSLDRKETDE